MSTLIVEVCKIENVLAHHNADALDLAQIKGWQCVIPKGRYAPGDLVTYIPIDAVIPAEHSDRWGITKYIPPIKTSAGDAEASHSLFVEYTEVENLRNFPTVFTEGEEVSASEKIYGTSCRLGLVEGEWTAGSMSVRRRRPEDLAGSIYWQPMALPGIQDLLTHLGEAHRQVILYREVFGSKVQSLAYGQVGTLGFRAFDLLADGKYLDASDFDALCGRFGVPAVPVLYRGPYALETVKALSEGATTLGADHTHEGVVVRPVLERTDPKVGRVCLKYIGDPYLFAKNVTDSHDV